MIWQQWILAVTDAVSISFVLMCFVSQMKKMNTGGMYSGVRGYFAGYLVLFSFHILFHFFRDLEFEHTMVRDSVYIVIDRMILLGMTIIAFNAYRRIK